MRDRCSGPTKAGGLIGLGLVGGLLLAGPGAAGDEEEGGVLRVKRVIVEELVIMDETGRPCIRLHTPHGEGGIWFEGQDDAHHPCTLSPRGISFSNDSNVATASFGTGGIGLADPAARDTSVDNRMFVVSVGRGVVSMSVSVGGSGPALARASLFASKDNALLTLGAQDREGRVELGVGEDGKAFVVVKGEGEDKEVLWTAPPSR